MITKIIKNIIICISQVCSVIEIPIAYNEYIMLKITVRIINKLHKNLTLV